MTGELELRKALQLVPVITFTATERGEIDWVSDRWYEVTGISRDDVLGEAWVRIVHPDDIEDVVWRWTQALDEGTPLEATPRVRHADGHYHLYFTRAERVEDAAGVRRWIGTAIDLAAVPWEKVVSNAKGETEQTVIDVSPT
ncbi:MAG: hypothetical protein NVSMB64_18380 [Candidatus Velthaea sp.]